MNTSIFHYENVDVRSSDIRNTNVRLPSDFGRRMRHLSNDIAWVPVRMMAGAMLLMLFAGLTNAAILNETVPMLLVVMSMATAGVALDVGRVRWLLVAAVQTAVLVAAGYLLATGTLSVAQLIGLQAFFALLLISDYRGFRRASAQAWLGAEILLLFIVPWL